ncbi:MAG: 4-hydroxy-3-methylbut-2-enyl diphosphate reductase [Deltaproteobacteria bacterium]|nr:4-hydroxy-3-methylbut-2-enyl diphosphate reductase [Deltaproteobacteria bacterium]
MGIKLAETAGFCMGVKRAVDIVLEIARHKGDKEVFTYGPLIHNPQTVQLLKERGIVPLDSIDRIQDGIIVIRAHGVSPLEKKKIREKGVEIVDATCPKVASVQAIIKKYAALGYSIIIVGDKEHPEVASLLGYSSGRGVVINDKKDVDHLPRHDKMCVVAQTTQDSAGYKAIAKEITLKFPGTMVFDTICDSTEMRQAEIKELASKMDGIIIVGGRDSANTRRLATISQGCGTRTCHIETAEELDGMDLSGCKNIGVSAGASTPNWITEGVIDYLTHNRRETVPWKLRGLYNLWIFLVRTDISSAIGAGCLSLVSMFLQGLRVNVSNILIAALCVFAIHTINRLQERSFGRIQGSFREASYIKNRGIYMTMAIASLALASVLSFLGGLVTFILVGFISLSGVLYNVTVWGKRLEDVPGSKNIFTALGWAVVAAVVPQMSVNPEITCPMVVAFLFVFVLVFSKSVLSDTIDIQSDRLIGRETIPVIMGEARARVLLKGVSILAGIMLIAAIPAGCAPSVSLGFVLLVPVFYIWICLELCDKKVRFSRMVLEGLLGINYMIAGFSACLWFIATKI